MGPLPPDEFDTLRSLLLRRFRRWAPRADIDDAVQESLLALWRVRQRGHAVILPLVFTSTVVRRQLLRQRLLLRRQMTTSQADLTVGDNEVVRIDWNALLADLGHPPTAGRARLLALLAQGVRTSRGLSRLLDRDVATVKECRARLQR